MGFTIKQFKFKFWLFDIESSIYSHGKWNSLIYIMNVKQFAYTRVCKFWTFTSMVVFIIVIINNRPVKGLLERSFSWKMKYFYQGMSPILLCAW